MPVTSKRGLALSSVLVAATLLGAHAFAQSNAPAGPQSPAQSTQPAPDSGPRGPGYGGGYGGGYGMRGDRESRGGYHMGREYMGREGRGGRMDQLSETDRQAMFAARLAAVKAGLLLTPEQEKLWGPVENAMRENMKLRQEWRARMEKEGVAANPVDRMRRMGEMQSARGAAMTRLADAAAPLYNSLSDDQKRRLRMLQGMGGGRMAMMGRSGEGYGPRMGMREGRGHEGMRGHHERHHGGGYQGHHGYRGHHDGRGRYEGWGRGERL